MENPTFSLWVPEDQASTRLDAYLSQQKELEFSRSRIQQLVEAGHILVNGQRAKTSYKIRPSDRIEIDLPPAKMLSAPAEALPLSVLYEDEDLAVIDKSAEMVVHSAQGHESGTLVNALLFHLKNLSDIGGTIRPGIVHRLDKGTSGVMLVAKTNAAHLALSHQFQNREIEKTYLALAYGNFKSVEGKFESALGRSRTNRKKISSKTQKSKEALTFYKVLEHFENLSLVELKPKTGRTHQIRVHLAEAGYPIAGDPLYGGKHWVQKLKPPVRAEVEKLTHQALHAWKIRLTHPTTGQELLFEAEIPEDLKKILQLLREK